MDCCLDPLEPEGSTAHSSVPTISPPMSIQVPPAGSQEPHESIGTLEFREKQRYRMAAMLARRMYPGPVGELINRELRYYADFGYRSAAEGLLPRLMATVMATDQSAADRPYFAAFFGPLIWTRPPVW
jgi:hypothetical protein